MDLRANGESTRSKRTIRKLILFLLLLAFVLPVAWIFYWGAWGRRPRIPDPVILVIDCDRLCRAHGTRDGALLDRSHWPESIRRLGPVCVGVERDNVDIRISGGGIDPGWGYLVVDFGTFDLLKKKGRSADEGCVETPSSEERPCKYRKRFSAFEAMLLSSIPCFTSPTCETFAALAIGWILCLGRPTVVRLVASAGELAKKHLSTYHRFFRTAKWEMDEVFKMLVTRLLVPWFGPTGEIVIAGDDTTCEKTGRKVASRGTASSVSTWTSLAPTGGYSDASSTIVKLIARGPRNCIARPGF